MYKVSTSGQALGISFISAFSGTALTGLSGLISGYKSVDGGSQAGISGYIVETAFGQYVANLFDWDTSGRIISFYFLGASGAIPVEKTVVTTLNISGFSVIIASGTMSGQPVTLLSGQSYQASGINVTVPIASISGNISNSGLFVTVPTATISGVFFASGLTVILASGTMSGQPVTLLSGLSYPASGVNATVPIASLSGVVPNVLSGTVFLASGSVTSGVISSGIFVTATAAAPASGTTFLASGTALFYSGYYYPASGMTFIASGPNVVVPPSTLSGVVTNSGLNVTVPIASISGVTANSGLSVIVPVASISGVYLASGSLSGQFSDVNLTKWLGVAPNALISSGRVDAAFNVRTGVARSGTSTTIQLDAGVPTGISGVYDNSIITIVGGTGVGRSRVIQNMGSSGIATVFPAWDASGAPDNTSIFTITPGGFTFSGLVYPASGANTVVPPSTLSGVIANSGLNVTVPIATISGMVPNVLSGTVFLASGSITSGVINSGIFVTATASVQSGQVYLASGSAQFYSGYYYPASGMTFIASGPNVVVPPSTLSGVTANSGLNVTVPTATLSGVVANSGLNVTVPIATISGTVPNVISGTVFLASGSITSGVINSGIFVTATAAAPASGTTYLASGHSLFWSGYVYPASGSVYPASGSITSGVISSGIFVTATATVQSGAVYLASGSAQFYSGYYYPASGMTFIASGPNVVVPVATLSGVTVTTASGTTYLASGTNATIQSGQVWLASGTALFYSGYYYPASGMTFIASGPNVVVPVASISGVQAASGLSVVARQVTDKSGYTLHSSGVDTITVESGMNLRQAVSIIAAATAGQLSGAGTTLFAFQGANASGILRISGRVDASGNRTAVAFNLPL